MYQICCLEQRCLCCSSVGAGKKPVELRIRPELRNRQRIVFAFSQKQITPPSTQWTALEKVQPYDDNHSGLDFWGNEESE